MIIHNIHRSRNIFSSSCDASDFGLRREPQLYSQSSQLSYIKDNLQHSQIQVLHILQNLLPLTWAGQICQKILLLVALNLFAMVHQIFRFITAGPSFLGHQTPWSPFRLLPLQRPKKYQDLSEGFNSKNYQQKRLWIQRTHLFLWEPSHRPEAQRHPTRWWPCPHTCKSGYFLSEEGEHHWKWLAWDIGRKQNITFSLWEAVCSAPATCDLLPWLCAPLLRQPGQRKH